MEWKNRETHWYEAVGSALNLPFVKESRGIVSLLMLSTLKVEDVSQNCFVFDVQKFRKPRRIVSFLMLSISKIEEASQACFVFDVVKFKH